MSRPRTTAWVRLQLDVSAFDEAPHRWALERAETAGITLTTMAELGDGPDARHALWTLHRDCAADMPERDAFPTFEEYDAERLEVASYRPDGVVVALLGEEWVGLSITSLRSDDDLDEGRYAFSEMTGVRRDHRGRGLSLAMKLHAIRFVRARRYRWLRTFQHPENRPAIAMNLRLGFEKPPEP